MPSLACAGRCPMAGHPAPCAAAEVLCRQLDRPGIAAAIVAHSHALAGVAAVAEPEPLDGAALIASLDAAQLAAIAACPERREVESCCGPVTQCRLGRIRSNATASADCARCVVSRSPR